MDQVPFAQDEDGDEKEQALQEEEDVEELDSKIFDHKMRGEEHEHEVDARADETEEETDEHEFVRFNRLNNQEVKGLTGFSLQEFLTLSEIAQDVLLPMAFGKKGKPAKKLASSFDRLLLLTWLRHAEEFRRLASTFGVSKSYCYALVMCALQHVTPLFSTCFIKKISHEEQKNANILHPLLPQVAALLDTKTQACTKPASSFHAAKVYSSYKHHKYGIKTLTLHALDGMCMFVSESEPASVADITMARKQGTINEVIL